MQIWTFMSTKLNLVWIFDQLFQDYWNSATRHKHRLSYVQQIHLLFPSMYLVPLLNFIYANWTDTTRRYVENSEKKIKGYFFLLFYIPYMWYFCFFIQRRFFSRITFPSNVPQQTQLQFLKIGQNVNFCICLGLRYTAPREWFKNVRM